MPSRAGTLAHWLGLQVVDPRILVPEPQALQRVPKAVAEFDLFGGDGKDRLEGGDGQALHLGDERGIPILLENEARAMSDEELGL